MHIPVGDEEVEVLEISAEEPLFDAAMASLGGAPSDEMSEDGFVTFMTSAANASFADTAAAAAEATAAPVTDRVTHSTRQPSRKLYGSRKSHETF